MSSHCHCSRSKLQQLGSLKKKKPITLHDIDRNEKSKTHFKKKKITDRVMESLQTTWVGKRRDEN